ncbi:MAG: VanZ family protein [Candidatus Omnitrophica bacterium]|nr:VanZ family protein [Candidatus Omnitrophota bacterium]
MDRVKFCTLWLPVIAWAGLIFFCSALPHLKTNLSTDFILRKAAHITEYFVLALLLRRAFLGTFSMDVGRLSFYSAGFAVLYAISDEIHQFFVPGRSCAITDVGIDIVGIILFYVFLKIRKLQTAS